LIEYDYELTQANLADVDMPNKNGFFFDDRPDVRAKRCMHDCKKPGSIKITSQPAEAAEPDIDTADAGVEAVDYIISKSTRQ
jgi:cytochrome c